MKAVFKANVLVAETNDYTKYDVIDDVEQPIIVPNILEISGHVEECMVTWKESIIKFSLVGPHIANNLSHIYKVTVEYNTRGSIDLFFRTREEANQFKADITVAIDAFFGAK